MVFGLSELICKIFFVGMFGARMHDGCSLGWARQAAPAQVAGAFPHGARRDAHTECRYSSTTSTRGERAYAVYSMHPPSNVMFYCIAPFMQIGSLPLSARNWLIDNRHGTYVGTRMYAGAAIEPHHSPERGLHRSAKAAAPRTHACPLQSNYEKISYVYNQQNF